MVFSFKLLIRLQHYKSRHIDDGAEKQLLDVALMANLNNKNTYAKLFLQYQNFKIWPLHDQWNCKDNNFGRKTSFKVSKLPEHNQSDKIWLRTPLHYDHLNSTDYVFKIKKNEDEKATSAANARLKKNSLCILVQDKITACMSHHIEESNTWWRTAARCCIDGLSNYNKSILDK